MVLNTEARNELQSVMFTSEYLFHLSTLTKPVSVTENITFKKEVKEMRETKEVKENPVLSNIYQPTETDTLFWCFYIIKNGLADYEVNVNMCQKSFTIEKSQKFAYIQQMRTKKDLLKLHKIKPFTEVEDDLSNQERIRIKTFFALCVLENINVLLVDNRKVFELLLKDNKPIHVVHKDPKSHQYYLETVFKEDKALVANYRENYYIMNHFDSKLKAMSSYKLDELYELCNKLNIDITGLKVGTTGPKKPNKKDIYELLVQHY
jgi:hypothetical protein